MVRDELLKFEILFLLFWFNTFSALAQISKRGNFSISAID